MLALTMLNKICDRPRSGRPVDGPVDGPWLALWTARGWPCGRPVDSPVDGPWT
jgi:hypothetical protein